ncbi:hypothetical protein PENSPDRAFT_752293 [Peniophora sp. CONT]|nr:hypothetical protein PENSPDRAFT_752293 [Peniophora sp. CONT]
MTETQLQTVQRLPIELVQRIVINVLRDQLEDIVFRPQSITYHDAYPSLGLLHLCSVFRQCTIEILEHMWRKDESGSSSFNHIPLITSLRMSFTGYSEHSIDQEPEELIAHLDQAIKRADAHISSPSKPHAPMFHLLMHLCAAKLARRRYMAVSRLDVDSEVWRFHALDTAHSGLSLCTSTELVHYMSLSSSGPPAWLSRPLLSHILPECFQMSTYLIRFYSLSMVAMMMNGWLSNLSAIGLPPNFVHDMMEQINLAAAAMGKVVQTHFKGCTALAERCAVDNFFYQLTDEDMHAAGATRALHDIGEGEEQGHFDADLAQQMRECLRSSARLTDAEAEILGFPQRSAEEEGDVNVAFIDNVGAEDGEDEEEVLEGDH